MIYVIQISGNKTDVIEHEIAQAAAAGLDSVRT
jgi:hypothetical protein